MKHSVLTVGKMSVKTNYNVPMLKTMGHSEADMMKIEPYGSALVCSLLISRLGGEGIVCSKIGNDLYGTKLKQFCESENVTTRFLFSNSKVATAGETVINNGAYKITFNGAGDTLTADEIENAMIRYPDIALVDMSVDRETVRRTFEYANVYEVRTIASFSKLEHPDDFSFISGCDTIIVDAISAKTLTNIAPQGPDMCVKVCLKLHYDFSPKYVVLRLGERGSIYYDGKHCEFYPGIDSSESIDELAEYSFIGTFAYDYVKSESISHACMAANIVSGLTSLKCDSVYSLPTAKEVNDFVKERELKI